MGASSYFFIYIARELRADRRAWGLYALLTSSFGALRLALHEFANGMWHSHELQYIFGSTRRADWTFSARSSRASWGIRVFSKRCCSRHTVLSSASLNRRSMVLQILAARQHTTMLH